MDIFGKIDIGNMMKKKMMGGDDNYKEAYIRIQNRSSHSRIRVSIPRVKNAKASSSSSSSLDGLLSGDVRANSSLPDDGGGEVGPFANGRRYARVIFGKDDQNDNDDNEDDGICGRLVGKLSLDNGGGGGGGKGGLVVFEARVASVHAGGGGGDRGGAATLRLISNDDGWRCEDDRGSSSSPIKLAADVTEMSRRGNGGNGGDVMVFWKVELRIYDDIDTTRWMEVLGERIEDVPFNRIGLPGTHDSGTYTYDRDMGASPDSDLTKTIDRFCPGMLGDAILGNVFARLCQCQSKSILDQLRSGVRYLDLRIARHAESGKYYTCHGVYCADMSNVIREINTFLSNHPREIVVLDFNHLYDMDGHHPEFLKLIFDALGDKVASPKGVGCTSRISDFWTKKKQAMVIYHASSDVWKDLPFANLIYHNGYIHSPWPEANDVDDLHAKLSGYVKSRYDDDKRANQLFVIQGMLTPDVELIKSGLMRGDGISIRAYANDTNARVVDWCEEEWMMGGRATVGDDDAGGKGGGKHRMLNIVIVDFIEGTSIIPAIINYNGRR